MSGTGQRRNVVICGVGSLGTRLAQNLIQHDYHLLLLDDFAGFHKGQKPCPSKKDGEEVRGSFEHVQADFTEWGSWTSSLENAYAVVAFAAMNPYPEASWEDSRLSMRMSSNIVAAAQRGKVRRLVLASSSHVLGGYMQDGPQLSETAKELGPRTPLRHFTRFRLPGFETEASGYAAPKVVLEELGRTASLATPGLSVVAVRIGWCQPGENHPRQMTATATPTISGDAVTSHESVDEEVAKGFDNRDMILAWLHRIWLSTRDFQQLIRRAVETELDGYRVVCGMSANTGMRWSKEGWEELGYEPQDDAVKALSEPREDMASPKRQRV